MSDYNDPNWSEEVVNYIMSKIKQTESQAESKRRKQPKNKVA